MKKNYTVGRSRFWWLWPEFNSEKDARDIVKMGLGFVVLATAFTGGYAILKYFQSNEVENMITGSIIVIIFSVLGYGIFRMSRVAATLALILIVGNWVFDIASGEKTSGAPFVFMWALFQTNRAIYWFNGEKNLVSMSAIIKTCPVCGNKYSERDYDPENINWFCSTCNAPLKKG